MKKRATPNIDAFLAHLDVCAQCEQNPFDLCDVGMELIQKTVLDADPLFNSLKWGGKARV